MQYISLLVEYFRSLYSGGLYPSVPGRPSTAVTIVLFAFHGGSWIENPKSASFAVKCLSIGMLLLQGHVDLYTTITVVERDSN